MKIYSKLLGKIRKNKVRVKKAVGIVTVAVGLRYGNINSIPTNLSSNYTQQVERAQPTTYLEMEKPASMQQQQYSAMTKLERRQLPDPRGRDGFIKVEGYPRLDLRFNQVEFKTPKHGPDHGLPIDSKGKTPKNEANFIALRDSLIDMPNRQNIIWYIDGQYQGITQRGCDCVNLFDPDTNLIAVYQKQPDGSNLFLTTCKLTQMEGDHLKATNGNFVTERILKEQSAVSINIQDNTNNNNGLQ